MLNTAPHEVKVRQIRANGTIFKVLESGQGPPLLLIHGGMGTASDNFSDTIEELSATFTVFAPDSRGHGNTPNPLERLTYSVMADDMAELVSALHLAHPYIIGWSDGGQIALDIGIRYPDLPAAIVVGGAYLRLADQYIGGAKAVGIQGPGQVDFDVLSRSLPDLVEHWRELHSIQGADYWKTLFLALTYAQMNPPPYEDEDLRRIVSPTLIFLGDRDQFVPAEQALEMYRLIPSSQLAIFPGEDHSLRRTPGLVSRLASDFIVKLVSSQ